MMRMIFVAEHKRWEASLARAAAKIPTIQEEDEDGEHSPKGEADYFVAASDDKFEAFDSAAYEDNFEQYLDRDGQELEDLLSQMDLDLQ